MKSIKTGLRKIFRFTGRTTRAEFWPFMLFGAVLYLILSFAAAVYILITAASMEMNARSLTSDGSLSEQQFNAITQSLISLIFKVTALPGVFSIFLLSSAITRRLHDLGKSGILIFSFLLIIVFHLAILTFAGEIIVNNPRLKIWAQIALWGTSAYEIFVLVMIVIATVRESEPFDNAHGPNPYPSDFEALKQSISSISGLARSH